MEPMKIKTFTKCCERVFATSAFMKQKHGTICMSNNKRLNNGMCYYVSGTFKTINKYSLNEYINI